VLPQVRDQLRQQQVVAGRHLGPRQAVRCRGRHRVLLTRCHGGQTSATRQPGLVTGDFTAFGGAHRDQVLQLDVGTTAVTLNGWTSSPTDLLCAP
jgi:hypothetical protein